ncbi:MAG: phosphate ABC transporter substrate-binding protein [Roseburia sp.]
MKKKMVKLLALTAATTMAVASLTACGSEDSTSDTSTADATTDAATDETADDAEENTDTADLSGSIALAGSTSMEKLANALMEAFMEKYPDVTVTTEFTGSSAGLESLQAGSVDIGNASRALSDDEKNAGAVENIVAIDGIAVITDLENTVTELTSDELAKIYTGEVTNWSELGGSDEAIVVIGREAGSGTRDAFEELLEVKDACNYAQELDSTGAVLAKVAATPGAIGYVSLDVLDGSVTPIALNGVEATEENIVAGDYLLSRPFVMATMGEISEQNELVQAWFDYIQSEEGQEVVKGAGLIIPQ